MLSYLPILVMAGIALFMACVPLFISSILSPKNPYSSKLSPWECGMPPQGDASQGRFRVQFFVIAILFVVFDVETLYLFPWAVILTDKGISTLAFIEMFIFIGVLAIGLIYAWAKGALDWIE